MSARLDQACPLLAAADVPAAAAWYRDKLGFEVGLVQDDYAIVRRDAVELHLWRCDDRHVAENTSAYIRVADPDAARAACGRAVEGGRVSEVEDRPWGMREFYVWDPDGNLLRFGARQPARAPADNTKALLARLEAMTPDESRRDIEASKAALRADPSLLAALQGHKRD